MTEVAGSIEKVDTLLNALDRHAHAVSTARDIVTTLWQQLGLGPRKEAEVVANVEETRIVGLLHARITRHTLDIAEINGQLSSVVEELNKLM